MAANPPRRIFVPGREHIGDAVNLTGPLLGLRRLFPEAHITVEVGEKALPIISALPGLNEIWPRAQHQGVLGKASHIRRLQTERFDLAVILDDSNNLVLQAKLGGIPRRVGIWRGKKYEDLFDAYVRLDPSMHEVRDHGEAVIQMLGLREPCAQPKLFPMPEDDARAEEVWTSLSPARPAVGIHMGASVPERRMPPAFVEAIAKGLAELGATPVLLAGTPDEEQMAAELPLPESTLILKSGLKILAFAQFLSRLDLMICTDSGPMHLRAASGGKVCALFWVTRFSHTGPWGEGHTCLQSESGRFDFDPTEVLALAQKMLEGRPS